MIPYQELVQLNFTDASRRFQKIESISQTRRVIATKSTEELPTYMVGSDLVLYYDVLSDSEPLLVVERIPRKTASVWKIKRLTKRWDKHIPNYVITVNKSQDGLFTDICLVKSNIYTNLEGQNGTEDK